MTVQSPPKGRALVVYDDKEARNVLALSMNRAGYDVEFAESARDALAKVRKILPNVVITDLHMPGMNDTTLLQEIRSTVPEMSIVVLTTSAGIAPALEAVRVVADDFVTEPVDPDALHFAVERAVGRKKERAETELMRRTLAELRAAHLALRAERDFVSTVLATIDSLVVVLDRDHKIVHFNAACEKATGYSEAEVQGQNVFDVFVESDERSSSSAVFEALLSGQTIRNANENHWRSKDRGRRRVNWTNSVLYDERHEVRFIVATGVDVTDARNMEARVRRSEHLASIATFSAGVAHEIKNPLNAAMLHLQLLTRVLGKPTPDLESAREASGIASGEIRRVAALLEEFLQFARPEKPQRSMTDLRQICDDVAALCRVEADAAHIELRVTGEAALETRADDARMRQVVLNLVRNAIEAVRANGHIEIEVTRSEELARVRVQDDGPGLVADEVKIFQPFFTTKEKGTGLGLAITHRIVTDHGGDIAVESRPGKTVFTIVMPIDRKSSGR